MMTGISEFLNTEINQTIGSQLIWLMITVIVTIAIGTVLSQTNNLIRKGVRKLICKMKKRYNQPLKQNKRLYKKIKKDLKRNKNLRLNEFPPGVSLDLYMEFIDAKKDGVKLQFEPLHDILVEYELEYHNRLEKYYEMYPEEKIKAEAMEKDLAESFKLVNNNLKDISPLFLPKK